MLSRESHVTIRDGPQKAKKKANNFITDTVANVTNISYLAIKNSFLASTMATTFELCVDDQ